jgi:hypothetical protein
MLETGYFDSLMETQRISHYLLSIVTGLKSTNPFISNKSISLAISLASSVSLSCCFDYGKLDMLSCVSGGDIDMLSNGDDLFV